MVRDGYYYGLAALVLAVLLWVFTIPVLAIVPVLLGAFFLWFFRDPERIIPDAPGAIVSPADGKVTSVAQFDFNGRRQTRVSIFLNVFDVHVNRTPIGGKIRNVEYRKGKFHNAMGETSSEHNEQNIVTIEGDGQTVVLKQIAGLLARRIVFNYRVGDTVQRGQRIGLMKFGSRCDVIFDTDASVKVKVGDKVSGGSSVLAISPVTVTNLKLPKVPTGERA